MIMANKLLNDRDEWVRSVGSPGSPERIKSEYPRLIKEIEKEKEYSRVNAYPDEQYGWSNVEALMDLHDLTLTKMECESLSEIIGIEY